MSIYHGTCRQFTRETHSFTHYFAMQFYDLFEINRNHLNHMMQLYTTSGATMEESVCAWMQSIEGREVWEPWKAQIISPYHPPANEKCNLFKFTLNVKIFRKITSSISV